MFLANTSTGRMSPGAHGVFPFGSPAFNSVIPGSWTTIHRESGLYSFIAAAILAVFSPKLR